MTVKTILSAKGSDVTTIEPTATLVSVRRLLDSLESLGFDRARLDSRRGLRCGQTRTERSTTAIN